MGGGAADIVIPGVVIVGGKVHLPQGFLNIDQLNPQLFETSVSYKVDEPTPARLTLRQQDDRMDGWFYIYSQEITLNP